MVGIWCSQTSWKRCGCNDITSVSGCNLRSSGSRYRLECGVAQIMTKLDWSKGYTDDPARTRSVEDFSNPDPVIVKGRRKTEPGLWAVAINVLRARRAITEVTQIPETSRPVLKALGISKRTLRSKRGDVLLRKFVQEGILLESGLPNPRHPKVKAVLAAQKAKK